VKVLHTDTMRRAGLVLCLIGLGAGAHAVPRILIVGDSWAVTVWAGRAIDQVLQEYGINDVESVGDLTARGGSTAEDWTAPDWLAAITQQLNAYPTIDTVHLIIGGNDVLSKIKTTNVFTGWPALLRESWWQEIQNNVQVIVNYCLMHPQVKHVVISDYDYLNRATVQVIYWILGQTFDFGGMTQGQVNTAFIEVGLKKLAVAQRTPGCYYVQNFGLLQYHHNTPAGAPHPGVYPDYSPYPGGNSDYPMPDAAFDTIQIGPFSLPGDGIHPSVEAHKVMVRNAV